MQQHPTQHPTLRLGIVGLGRLGRQHARTLAWKTRHAQLISACSPQAEDRTWAQSELGLSAANTHADLSAVLADPNVDAVVLVTPTTLHADQTIQALRAGKHVFVEKPLAMEVHDCERVIQEANARPQQQVMVGYMRRHDPSLAHAKALIDAGAIGKPYLLHAQTCDKLDPSGFFVRFAATSGGIFMDCSVHDIDMTRWLLTKPGGHAPQATRVYATGVNAVHQELAEFQDVDNGMAIVEFGNEVRAIMHASRTWVMGHETGVEIVGTQGKLRIGLGADASRDRLELGDTNGLRHLVLDDFFQRFETAFEAEMQAFVDTCLNIRPLASNLQDAKEATRIARAMSESLHRGSPVDL